MKKPLYLPEDGPEVDAVLPTNKAHVELVPKANMHKTDTCTQTGARSLAASSGIAYADLLCAVCCKEIMKR